MKLHLVEVRVFMELLVEVESQEGDSKEQIRENARCKVYGQSIGSNVDVEKREFVATILERPA